MVYDLSARVPDQSVSERVNAGKNSGLDSSCFVFSSSISFHSSWLFVDLHIRYEEEYTKQKKEDTFE